MEYPEPKRKIKLRKNSHKNGNENNKKSGHILKAINQSLEGVDKRKIMGTVSKALDMPRKEIRELLEGNFEALNQIHSELAHLTSSKALRIIQKIDPDKVKKGFEALTSAILIDKSLKLLEALKQVSKPETSPQTRLLDFVNTHKITFDQLKEIIKTGKLPPEIPSELWLQMKAILFQVEPRTLDLPMKKSLK
jgi:DNA-binding Lrp family transcriptional regulator